MKIKLKPQIVTIDLDMDGWQLFYTFLIAASLLLFSTTLLSLYINWDYDLPTLRFIGVTAVIYLVSNNLIEGVNDEN